MEKILVTGATGQLGTEVIQLLLDKMDSKFLSVLVRDTSKAESFKAKGVTIYKGDYNDYNSLVQAFKGIDKLYFISTSDLVNREAQHENVVKAAVEAKVKHIVYTSFQRKNETESNPFKFIAAAHIFTDKLIKASGLTYTILKHGIYSDFLPAILGEQVFETGKIYFPAGEGKITFTARTDLAHGGVSVLAGKGHENKTYEFYSDRPYSFGEIASILSDIKNKPVSYVPSTLEEYKVALTKAGLPANYVNLFAGCAEGIKQGEFDTSDNTLSKLIGRKCTSLEEFLANVYKN